MNEFRVTIVDENENTDIFTNATSVIAEDGYVRVEYEDGVELYDPEVIRSVKIEINR